MFENRKKSPKAPDARNSALMDDARFIIKKLMLSFSERKQRFPNAGLPDSPLSGLYVWDLPTRIFHWALVFFVVISFATGKAGGNAMRYHVLSGGVLLWLLLFRVAWGIIGSKASRFSDFVVSPKTVVRYAAGLFRKDSTPHPGHNPMGGWSVLAMLVLLFFQTITGLFASDDIFTQGPLYAYVSASASRRLTALHTLNPYPVGALVALHVAAVLFYLIYKKENLIWPMLTGWKTASGEGLPSHDTRPLWLAAVPAVLSAAAVYLVFR